MRGDWSYITPEFEKLQGSIKPNNKYLCWKIECFPWKQGYGLIVQCFFHTVMIQQPEPNAMGRLHLWLTAIQLIQRAIAFDFLQKDRRMKQRLKHFFPLRSTINLPSSKSFPLCHEKELLWFCVFFFSFLVTPMDINLIFSRVFVIVFF